LGAIAARRLGVTDVARRPAVLIDDVPFVVVGVLDSADTRPDLLADAMLPRSTSVATWGQPSPGGDSALAFICQIVGAVGIANTTLVAVFERTGELGLRRALGAKRRHLAAHIVTESATLGLIGGVVGAAVGVAVVLVTALTKSWTPIIHPLVNPGAPLLGLATGAVTGLYPAAKQRTSNPAEALRR